MHPKLNMATIVGGVVLAVVCSAFMGAFTPLFNYILNNTLTISKGSATFSAWVSPPLPVYMKFYFFHVNNPLDVQHYGAKPDLTEMGPYVYQEHKSKENIVFGPNGDTVQYKDWVYYTFDQEQSGNLTEDDEVITLNILMVIGANLLNSTSSLNATMKSLAWGFAESEFNLYEKHTVKEWLFQGFELPTLYLDFENIPIANIEKQIKKFDFPFNGTMNEFAEKYFNTSIPQIATNRIGYYSTNNGSTDGQFVVDTGKSDMSSYLHVLEWNNMTSLPFWNDTYCDMMNGTDGTQFPPNSITRDTTVRMFVTQLCRSMYLNFEKQVLSSPFEALRFTAPPSMLASPTKNPDNKCFEGSLGVLGDSMMQVSKCMQGMPIVMSTPHFYQGDQADIDNFIGLKPNKSKHETYLDLVPVVGVPYAAHKRIQVNLPLGPFPPSSNMLSFTNLRKMIHPVFWADECAEMDDASVNTLKGMIKTPYTIVYGVGGGLLALGVILFAVGMYFRVKSGKTA